MLRFQRSSKFQIRMTAASRDLVPQGIWRTVTVAQWLYRAWVRPGESSRSDDANAYPLRAAALF
jgi:hypothetical protein